MQGKATISPKGSPNPGLTQPGLTPLGKSKSATLESPGLLSARPWAMEQREFHGRDSGKAGLGFRVLGLGDFRV